MMLEFVKPKTYRNKPVEIKAIKYNGYNYDAIREFCGNNVFATFDGQNSIHHLVIRTLAGDMAVNTGDYVIQGVKGEFYSCKPDIFEMTYDVVDYCFTV